MVQTKIVKPVIEIKERPKGVKMHASEPPVKFYVVTEKNYEEFKERFKKENGEFVFYAMSVPSYENLALDMERRVTKIYRTTKRNNHLL